MARRRDDSSDRSPDLVVQADTFVPAPEIENPEYVRAGDAYVRPNDVDDPRDLKVHRDQPPRDVPYLPTDQIHVNKMLEMARVGKGDVLYDLGCGDGRIVITAAKLGARGVGVEIDLQRLRECHENLRNTQLRHMVEFRRQSFFDVDLRPATVVALYLLPAINKLLRPKFFWELRPGSRIVANYFEIADWEPDEMVVLKHRPVMLWIVPAWVEGDWHLLFRKPNGDTFHARLHLTRHMQHLRGHLHAGKHHLPITGRIRGTAVKITIPPGPLPGPWSTETNLDLTYTDNATKDTSPTLTGTYRQGQTKGLLFAHLTSAGPKPAS